MIRKSFNLGNYLKVKKYLLAIFTVFVMLSVPAIAKETLRLATGGEEGTYYSLGRGIKKAIEEQRNEEIKENHTLDSIEVQILSTQGSIENLELLKESQADVALIQDNIAARDTSVLWGIASLYTELIQIVVGKDLYINNITDLKGRTVSVGSPNSGTRINTEVILKNLDIKNINKRFLSLEQSRDSLMAGTIDAAFITAGDPTAVLLNLELSKRIDFIPIPHKVARNLIKVYPYFVFATIPRVSYLGRYKDIPTLGVRVLLVVRKGIDPQTVNTIKNAIFSKKQEILKYGHSVASKIYWWTGKRGMQGIPLHPEMERYYKKRFLQLIFWITLILVTGIIAIIKYGDLIWKIIWRKTIYGRLALLFVCLSFIGLFLMWLGEHEINENFIGWNTIISGIVYIFSGFEGKMPITPLGWVGSIFVFLASLVTLGTAVGLIAPIFLKKEVKMPKDVSGHIAICNWNDGGDKIVKEIHSQQAEPETEIVVVTQRQVNEEELRKSKEYEKVYFIRSDPTLHSVLKAARIQQAKSVIILADMDSPDPDAKSALIALAVTKLCKTDNKPHIVVQAINHRKMDHLRDAGADEVICATDFGLGLLAQCSLQKKLSNAYEQLLVYSEDTNDLYIVDKFPEQFIGKTFEEVAEILNKNRDPNNPAILVGLRRGEEIILNPRKPADGQKDKKFERFQKGDALLVMAFKLPDLSKIKF